MDFCSIYISENPEYVEEFNQLQNNFKKFTEKNMKKEESQPNK